MAILPMTVSGGDAPKGWVPFSISDEALRCGSYSKLEWKVAFKNGRLEIGRVSRETELKLPFVLDGRGKRSVQKVDDGWLAGFDAGEWGGELWWLGEKGSPRRRLSQENVVGLAPASEGFFVFTGLAHLGTDRGGVLLASRGASGWEARKLAELGSAIWAFAAESSESVLALTTKRLVRVQASGKIDVLLETRYRGLYPNSLALAEDGAMYVGMRHFITRLTPGASGYTQEWFVPESCRRFELRGIDCVCLDAGKKAR